MEAQDVFSSITPSHKREQSQLEHRHRSPARTINLYHNLSYSQNLVHTIRHRHKSSLVGRKSNLSA